MIDQGDLPPDSEPEETTANGDDAQPVENTGDDGSDVASPEESMSQPAEHTGEPAEIQAKDAPEGVPEGSGIDQVSEESTSDDSVSDEPQEPLTLLELLERKSNMISQGMAEKEKLMLATIDQEIPEPYYESWRTDVNQHFSLLVRLNKRLHKAGKAS